MEREEIPEEGRGPAKDPELEHFYALVLMHERTRLQWATEDHTGELARKLAAVRTELLQRERLMRKEQGG